MLFIKFSSGNIKLPAPGRRWNKDLEVHILSKSDIPFNESEEELAKILRFSINFSSSIMDSNETPDAVLEFT